MRFSSATFAVLSGLVAAAVAAPMGGDAASDLYARDFDAEVFERDFYDSVYERSEDGLEARTAKPVDIQIKFSGNSIGGTAAKKEDAMKIVESIMKIVAPKLGLKDGSEAAELGKVTAANNPANPLVFTHWTFEAPACEPLCEGVANVVEGEGGIHAIKTAHVKTSKNQVLYEKKPHKRSV